MYWRECSLTEAYRVVLSVGRGLHCFLVESQCCEDTQREMGEGGKRVCYAQHNLTHIRTYVYTV